jgi:hypothetical protein
MQESLHPHYQKKTAITYPSVRGKIAANIFRVAKMKEGNLADIIPKVSPVILVFLRMC